LLAQLLLVLLVLLVLLLVLVVLVLLLVLSLQCVRSRVQCALARAVQEKTLVLQLRSKACVCTETGEETGSLGLYLFREEEEEAAAEEEEATEQEEEAAEQEEEAAAEAE
jgi:hypothetical protein